jgi:ABC-2 type transport system permease protein
VDNTHVASGEPLTAGIEPVLSFLPPTTPVAMPVLYSAGDVSAWQAAVSAVLLAAGTVWMARTAATIYGRSILRTGSRVRLRQVLGRAPVS